jgi:hypothetical protein
MYLGGTHTRAVIGACVQTGWRLETIERELIDRAPISEDERAALWLYAWSLSTIVDESPVLRESLMELTA